MVIVDLESKFRATASQTLELVQQDGFPVHLGPDLHLLLHDGRGASGVLGIDLL